MDKLNNLHRRRQYQHETAEINLNIKACTIPFYFKHLRFYFSKLFPVLIILFLNTFQYGFEYKVHEINYLLCTESIFEVHLRSLAILMSEL